MVELILAGNTKLGNGKGPDKDARLDAVEDTTFVTVEMKGTLTISALLEEKDMLLCTPNDE